MYHDIVFSREAHFSIIVVADVSEGMAGSKIGMVNETLRQLGSMLMELEQEYFTIPPRACVLAFSKSCNWVPSKLVSCHELTIPSFDAAGRADYAQMCRRLSRRDLFQNPSCSYAPLILLISDGLLADTDEYADALEELGKNNCYKVSYKFALPTCKEANTELLSSFTGKTETVLRPAANSDEMLKKIATLVQRLSYGTPNRYYDSEEDRQTGMREWLLEIIRSVNTESSTAPRALTDTQNTMSAHLQVEVDEW